jgi:predicted AAA+ superfamily ATPase
MNFRSFCSVVEPDRSFPQPAVHRPRDFGTDAWHSAAYELAPFLNDLVQLWELYLTVGGYPKAVWDHLETGSISPNFSNGIWQVIFGEAIRSKTYPSIQIQRLMSELSQRLTAPTNFTQLAEDCGFADHSVASDRCADLIAAYIAWPCYPVGAKDLPNLLAQRKFYFYDPMLARLAHLLDDRNPAPSLEMLSEQQLGVSLLRAVRREQSATFDDYSSLMFLRTKTRSEVDFVGPQLDPAAFESKYVDSKKTQATATVKALENRNGVMASRAFFDPEGSVPWLPAAFIAWLLDPPIDGAG